jgi:hypothetical protein
MKVGGVEDFANPSVSLLNLQIFNHYNYSVMTSFVPSEAISPSTAAEAVPGCLVLTLPLLS